MTILENVYDKLAIVLRELRYSQGKGTSFCADDVVKLYKIKFRDDAIIMEQRQCESHGAHSLKGYLDGMLAGYAKLPIPPGPTILWKEPLSYQFE